MSNNIEILGHKVGVNGDWLNLTDMWRASGSPAGRGPSDWQALASAKEFIAYIEATLEAGFPGIQTKRGGRGIGGQTVGHWQIGLAYAKYLSPAFHAACNQIVRSYIEGREVRAPITAREMNAFARVGTLMLRTFGPRAAVQPIADLAARIGLRVDVSAAEVLRQAQLPLDGGGRPPSGSNGPTS